MHFGTALRLFRTDAGISLGELARRIGVSTAYLSRVEHGHDPAPTPDRLAAIARELDLPPLVLIELAAHTGAALAGYLQRVPAASALFLDIARRNLGTAELAGVQQYVAQSFPEKRSASRSTRFTSLLDPSRIVIGVSGGGLEDAIEVAVMRWDLGPRLRGRTVVEALLARERRHSSAIGAGVVVPHAIVKGAPATAGLVTMASPLEIEAPDGQPVRAAFVLLLPSGGRRHLELLAQVALLASRGVADAVAGVRSARRILSRLEALEAL
jgi:PTS system nitrogen regulatory IIA component